jgi:signal transduction histidine kinase/ActR/RegA family two-component response regulator
MRGFLAITAAATGFTAASSVVINGVLSLQAGGGFWTGWSDWTSCNTLGAAIGLPTALILLDGRHRKGFPAGVAEVAASALGVAALSGAVFYGKAPQELLFAPALLAVFRGGPRAAALATAASLAAAIPAVLWRTGIEPAAVLPPLRHAQMFHVVLYAVCLASGLALSRQARLKALVLRRQAAARAAQAKAQAANQAKSEFLATISHELRTPLNSILGFAGLVAGSADLSAENRRRLELVERAGRSLADIVNDLLDFSKLEAGRLELVLEPAAPAEILRDACAIVAPAAAAKGLSLRVAVEAADDARFALDAGRLRQVLLNLLSNAVKFTAQGEVAASLSIGADGVLRFEVADTGIGIAPEVQARLFQRFSQADSSISRSYGGTGLGLAISRALITQMGGEIGVESAPGAGARFWVTLAAAPAAAAIDVLSPPAEAPEVQAQVLLVDDHPMNRELGQTLLSLAGCAVTTAEDGAQALAAAQSGRFDVILMDVHMPVMDGLAAARAIRALPSPAGTTPIIALTADALPDQIARCRAAGMDDHVAKPIRGDELLAAIARALAPAEEDLSATA